MGRYDRVNPVEFLNELYDKVLTESLTLLSRGGMLFHQDGILVTDDLEEEFISPKNPPVVVETEHAVELSWLLFRLGEGLPDVLASLGRKVFYEELAEASNACITKETDLTGLALGVIAKAALLQAQALRSQAQAIKNELIASAGALSDLAEKID